MFQISVLDALTHELAKLPGIGLKSAQRMAYGILRGRVEYAQGLGDLLNRLHFEVHECQQCYNYTDQEFCAYCRDASRNPEVLCLVEEPSDILRIDGSGVFRGRYHVLHGVISPLDGIGADDLKIADLIQRIDQGLRGEGPRIKEIIFALDADLEGDTTILYLTRALQNKELKLTRIAHGVPLGSDIDYVDERTMGRALENRVEI